MLNPSLHPRRIDELVIAAREVKSPEMERHETESTLARYPGTSHLWDE